MAFGKELIRLRKASNMSVQKFADLVKINADRIRKWEQRDLNPRYDDTKKIEEYYNISIDELVKLTALPEVQEVPGINKSNYEKNDSNKSEDAILSLVESNKILAESGKILADGNKKLIESNSELAQIVKSLIKNSTIMSIGNALKGSEPIPPQVIFDFLVSQLSPDGKKRLGDILRNLKSSGSKGHLAGEKKVRAEVDS